MYLLQSLSNLMAAYLSSTSAAYAMPFTLPERLGYRCPISPMILESVSTFFTVDAVPWGHYQSLKYLEDLSSIVSWGFKNFMSLEHKTYRIFRADLLYETYNSVFSLATAKCVKSLMQHYWKSTSYFTTNFHPKFLKTLDTG